MPNPLPDVGRLAYGCMRYLDTQDPGDVDDAKRAGAFACIEAALEVGMTLFDHADIYCRGACEQVFGDWLTKNQGQRDRLVIATKCGVRFANDPAGSPHRYDLSPEHIRRSVDLSLERLRCGVIDIYQLHRPDLLLDVDAVADVFVELRDAGKVRHFGISNFSLPLTAALYAACAARSVPLVVHQIELHAIDPWRMSDGLLDQCQELDMLPLSWSPLAGGKLSDRKPRLRDGDHANTAENVRLACLKAGRELGVDTSAAALAFLLKHPAGIMPIVGSANPDRIRQSASAASVEMTREQWYRIHLAARSRALP